MVAVVACPPTILQFFDNAGKPAVGGSVLTQVASVNFPTYSDSAGTTPLPNPIPLNSRGEVSTAAGASSQLFVAANTVYTFTLSDAGGNLLNTSTYVNGIGGISQASNVAGTNTITAVLSPAGALIVEFTPANTNTGATTFNAVPVLNFDGTPCVGGELVTGIPAVLLLNATATAWIIANPQQSSGTFTGTLTGCTSSPTATFAWKKIGDLVVLTHSSALQGTSNSNAMTITGLPSAIIPNIGVGGAISLADNGLGVIGSFEILAATSVITLFRSVVSGTAVTISSTGFTASGVKGLNGSETHFIYRLR